MDYNIPSTIDVTIDTVIIFARLYDGITAIILVYIVAALVYKCWDHWLAVYNSPPQSCPLFQQCLQQRSDLTVEDLHEIIRTLIQSKPSSRSSDGDDQPIEGGPPEPEALALS